jgi:hypothetical protein
VPYLSQGSQSQVQALAPPWLPVIPSFYLV